MGKMSNDSELHEEWDPHSLHTSIILQHVELVLGYTYIVMSVIGVVMNGLAIGLFLDFRLRKRGRKIPVSTMLFLHLAVTDLISSVIVYLFTGFSFLDQSHTWDKIFFTVLCNVKGVVFNIASRQAVNIFALISFGRCLATLYPMQCGMWYTKSRVLLALCVTWCLSILLSTLIYMRGGVYQYYDDVSLCTWSIDDLAKMNPFVRSVVYFIVVTLPVMAPALVTIVCLSLLVKFFRKKQRVDREHRTLSRDDFSHTRRVYERIDTQFRIGMRSMVDSRRSIELEDMNPRDRSTIRGQRRTSKNSQKKRSHPFFTLVIIVSSFLVCYSMWWFFYLAGFVVTLNSQWDLFRLFWSLDEDLSRFLLMYAILMLNVNSIVTPLIHVFRGAAVRSKVRRVWMSYVLRRRYR